MTYTINPSTLRGEVVLRFAPDASLDDMERGNALASRLGGRWVVDAHGWHMLPSHAKRWVRLFAAGFSVIRRYRPAPTDLYYLPGGKEGSLGRALVVAKKTLKEKIL